MNRPAVLDMDMAVTPRKSVPLPYDLQDDFCDDPSCEHGCAEMRQERDEFNRKHNGPDPAWDDVRKYVEGLETLAAKVNDIRNSIIGCQKMNWSEHIYPLVAALEEAGIEGAGYPEAREYVGTMLERTLAAEVSAKAAEARIAELEKKLADAERVISKQRDALQPLFDSVFNDNGDITVNLSMPSGEEFIAAYFADRAARAYMEGK